MPLRYPPGLSTVDPPHPGGKGVSPFPDLVPGAGTLPVGFQGRSALVAEDEIPKGLEEGEQGGEGQEF